MAASSSWRRGHRVWRMVGKLARAVGLALLVVAAADVAFPVAADEPSQAGLVIQLSADRIETQCIAFEGQAIAGNDFLDRSGLNLVIDATSGLGITVCQIEGQGCAFPAEHCFCQCMGGEQCRYWNYFYREPGAEAWTYSALGALLRQVQPGSVEAWVWGDGQNPPGEALTFEAICSPAGPAQPPPTPTAEPISPTAMTETQSPTSVATAAPTASAPPTAAMVRTTTPSPTVQPAASPAPASPATATQPASYGVFGFLMLGLLLIGVVVWLRRR